ncbi:MAG: hypothetical protein IJX04_07020 [Oscillospiraceae bacterium]|nr:hypothetical protein [Oscillospiraceae bacterium]
MRKLLPVLFILCLFSGCSEGEKDLDRAMALRADLLGCVECGFDVTVTADYGDEIHTFGMTCVGDHQGDLGFTVTSPDTVAGITGRFEGEKGLLTFDDFALEFPRLTDDQITPVSGPWILLNTLQGGYLTSCGADGELLMVTINDSYEDDALTLDIWLDAENHPVRAEILYDNRRIVTMDIENFSIS